MLGGGWGAYGGLWGLVRPIQQVPVLLQGVLWGQSEGLQLLLGVTFINMCVTQRLTVLGMILYLCLAREDPCWVMGMTQQRHSRE